MGAINNPPFWFTEHRGCFAGLAHNADATSASNDLGAKDGILGSKKSVFESTILCDEALDSGLGSPDITSAIAVKRYFELFFSDNTDDGPLMKSVKRTEVIKECTLEANTMRVSSALMQLGYGAIRRAQATNAPPPHPIPTLPRIAYAGIVIDELNASSGPIYLVEELVSNFRKFLPTQLSEPPIDLKSKEAYALAELFCAIQHVQFVETHGLAFVADFQGNESVLSDLKVMVDP
jgi:hypothetical protein